MNIKLKGKYPLRVNKTRKALTLHHTFKPESIKDAKTSKGKLCINHNDKTANLEFKGDNGADIISNGIVTTSSYGSATSTSNSKDSSKTINANVNGGMVDCVLYFNKDLKIFDLYKVNTNVSQLRVVRKEVTTSNKNKNDTIKGSISSLSAKTKSNITEKHNKRLKNLLKAGYQKR